MTTATTAAIPTRAERPFDIVLFGATGFTGRLVADYLNTVPNLRWAIAGRNRSKLETLRDELARVAPRSEPLPLLIADSADAKALAEVAAATRVVCTTVGPYDLHGEPLVAACVALGTDYCDLTGETPFIRRVVDRHHAAAVASGARIVHCCGFDSIPSDLGTHVLQQAFRARHGQPATRVRFQLVRASGGFSGGTVASLLNVVQQLKDPAVRRVLADPYSLNPEGERHGPDGGDRVTPHRDPRTGRWLGPFLMGPINTRIVRRTHALLGRPYGIDFRYSEVQRFGRGPRGLALATAVTAGLAAFMAATSVPALRRLLEQHVLPAPGTGPSERAIREGSFVAELEGTTADGRRLALRVEGRGDPGYGATSRMLAESALALAFDANAGPLQAGVLTPATALGHVLPARLAAAGIHFEVQPG